MEDEIITLVLYEHKLNVNKDKLMKESLYFSSLFSHNFNDSRKDEHIINYNINYPTLQDFIDWIHEDEYSSRNNSYTIKSCLIKFEKESFKDLLDLLQLSVLFVVDNLIQNVTDIIISHWLISEHVIDVWMLAHELGLNVLRDICLAVCLDQFTDLPILSLIELPLNALKQLIENVNVRSKRKYLCFVLNEWAEHNKTLFNMHQVNLPVKKSLTFLKCMIGYKSTDFESKGYIYCWNGTKFYELTRLKELTHFNKELIGVQIAGRGFSIYLIGGEHGLGTGHFNKVIWRYCVISKKWYYYASMQIPRRHMVVAFLSNCLYLVGGIGRHRLKLSSVHILNIHTGEWSTAIDIPEMFTEVPPYCVMKKKLFILLSLLYIFCPKIGIWTPVSLHNLPKEPKVNTLMTFGNEIFVNAITGGNNRVLLRITSEQKSAYKNCSKSKKNRTRMHPVYSNDLYLLNFAAFLDIGVVVITKHSNALKYNFLKFDEEVRNDLENFSFHPNLANVTIINPRTLYATSSAENSE